LSPGTKHVTGNTHNPGKDAPSPSKEVEPGACVVDLRADVPKFGIDIPGAHGVSSMLRVPIDATKRFARDSLDVVSAAGIPFRYADIVSKSKEAVASATLEERKAWLRFLADNTKGAFKWVVDHVAGDGRYGQELCFI